MIKLNRTFDRYMVNLKTSNKKLINRAVNIIVSITKAEKNEASRVLSSSGGNVEIAILMINNNLSYKEALKLSQNKFSSLKSKLNVRK